MSKNYKKAQINSLKRAFNVDSKKPKKSKIYFSKNSF